LCHTHTKQEAKLQFCILDFCFKVALGKPNIPD
jgi:hypothetical protein